MSLIRNIVAASMLLATPVMADEVVLKYSSFLPATTVNNAKSAPALIEKAAELSNGTLKIELFPGGSLVSGGEVQLKLVQDGVADIAEIPLPYTPGRVTGLDVFELPDMAETNTDGSLVSVKLIDDGLIGGMDGLIALGMLQAGPYYIHTRDKVESLADLRGKKLRVSGQTQAQIVSRLGAVPVSNIPATALAENVSRGLIDGALVDTGNLYNFGVGDLLKYHITNLPLGSFNVLFGMSQKRYDALPADAKAAIDQIRGEWYTTVLGENMDQQTAEVTARLEAAGDHHFVQLSPEDLAKAADILALITEQWEGRSAANPEIYQAARAALGK
ncbi:MAG: TRAP transporter substrate-binding protein DctP [Paracoccus sp. (in: a-proteobacteria)]|nr:TRAP transporter substrate-binding protein DctP [Paracoccus sp. (in: a-proteobacteria)]